MRRNWSGLPGGLRIRRRNRLGPRHNRAGLRNRVPQRCRRRHSISPSGYRNIRRRRRTRIQCSRFPTFGCTDWMGSMSSRHNSCYQGDNRRLRRGTRFAGRLPGDRISSTRDSPLSCSTRHSTGPRRPPYSRFPHLRRWKRIGLRYTSRMDRRRSAGMCPARRFRRRRSREDWDSTGMPRYKRRHSISLRRCCSRRYRRSRRQTRMTGSKYPRPGCIGSRGNTSCCRSSCSRWDNTRRCRGIARPGIGRPPGASRWRPHLPGRRRRRGP